MTQKKLNIILLTAAIIGNPHWTLHAYAEKAPHVHSDHESYAHSDNQSDEAPQNNLTTDEDKSPKIFCGVSCLTAVFRLHGISVKLEDIATHEYVGSSKGSSLQQLITCAQDHGMHAIALKNITPQFMKDSPYLIILHVKRQVTSKEFSHYELYMGSQDGRALLFDPPNPPKLENFGILLARMSGKGLVLSNDQIDLGWNIASRRLQLMAYGILAMLAVIGLRFWIGKYHPPTTDASLLKIISGSVGKAVGLVCISICVSSLYHILSNEGFFAESGATANIEKAYETSFLPKISVADVRHLLEQDRDGLLIDARFASDYASGHIDGAINIPMNSSSEKRQSTLKGIGKSKQIVVYCQSAGCSYDEILAKALIADGYRNIKFFHGGWAEWVAKNGKKEDASS